MKKAICFILLISLFATCVACSNANEEIFDVPDYNDTLTVEKAIDMNGYECIFLQENNYNEENTPLMYLTDSLYYDLMIQRVKDVETKYNCKITFDASHSAGANMQAYILRCFNGGIVAFDMYYGGNSNVNSAMAFDGYFYPLNELSDYIDLSDSSKYGGANLLECCMADGIPYGVVPVALPQKAAQACIEPIFTINEGLITSKGFTDPRDLYEQKTWTWDALDRVTDEYYISEGDTVIHSFATNEENYLVGFIGGCGMKIVYEMGDNLVAGYLEPQVSVALDKARTFRTEHKEQIRFPSISLNQILVEGSAVMTLNISIDINNIAKEMDNFGIVPFPVDGTTTQNGEETTFYSSIDTISINRMVEEPEFDAMILSALLDPINGYSESEMADFLYTTMFYDMRDVQIFMNLTKNSQFNYYAKNGYGIISSLMTLYKENTGTEVIEAIRNQFKDVINDCIAPNYYGYVKDHIQ